MPQFAADNNVAGIHFPFPRASALPDACATAHWHRFFSPLGRPVGCTMTWRLALDLLYVLIYVTLAGRGFGQVAAPEFTEARTGVR